MHSVFRGKLFKPSVMFAGKARVYQSETPSMRSILAHTQTLAQAEKGLSGKTL
jgi:hypothetical protein